MRPKVYGYVVDEATRCRHYHSERDIIALKFGCCDRYYPCYECHLEAADHPPKPWPRSRAEESAVLCGACGHEMTVQAYKESGFHCPSCQAAFNPGCRLHYDLYFEENGDMDEFNQAERLWKHIIEKGTSLEDNFEEALNLQSGATEEDFQLLERTLGVKLPEELKSFYRIHNGQVWRMGSSGFIRNLTLSPISGIIENWTFLQEEFDPDDLEAEIDIEIKPYLWNPKWIPIASNGGGDYLCIDTDPSEAGVVGQVLYFWHDWGRRSVEGKSLFAFIEICLAEED